MKQTLITSKEAMNTTVSSRFVPTIAASPARNAFLAFCCLMFLTTGSRAGDLTELSGLMKVRWPKNRTIQVVFHGHSVPAGYHKTPEVKQFESYPHLVNRKLKEQYPHAVINVITTAIGGEHSISGAARFERDVLSLKPDIIFIDYALNDRRLDGDQVRKSWEQMIAAAKMVNVHVVVLTPTGDASAKRSDPADPLNIRTEMIRALAKDHDVILADVSAAWTAELEKGTPQGSLLSQGNHPNLAGHTLAAETIFKALQKAGLE